MRPYYEHAGITILHGDALDVMADIHADFVVTDAPFGIADAAIQGQGRTGKRTGGVNVWHAESDWDKALDPAWSTLACAIAPTVAWFGHWRKRGEVEASMPHPLRCEIVWAKDTHCGPPCPAAMRDERIWVFAAAPLLPVRSACREVRRRVSAEQHDRAASPAPLAVLPRVRRGDGCRGRGWDG